jgi:hypothetical protein
MRKHISFTIAAAIMGLAIVFWAKASVVENNAKVELARASAPNPSFQVLAPSTDKWRLAAPHGLGQVQRNQVVFAVGRSADQPSFMIGSKNAFTSAAKDSKNVSSSSSRC